MNVIVNHILKDMVIVDKTNIGIFDKKFSYIREPFNELDEYNYLFDNVFLEKVKNDKTNVV